MTHDEKQIMWGYVQSAAMGCEESFRLVVDRHIHNIKGIARKYRNRDIPMEELIHVGMIALWKVCKHHDKYDKTRPFHEHISFPILTEITDVVNENRDIYLPYHARKSLSSFFKKKKSLTESLGYVPSDSEVIDSLNIKRPIIKEGLECALKINVIPISKDDYLDKKEKDDPSDALNKYFWCLTDNDKRIIEMFYGLYGDPVKITVIASLLRISSQDVRRRKDKAIQKIRETNWV